MDLYNSMDDETAALILQIQLQEANELLEATNIDTESTEWSDTQIAINTYLRELERNHTLIKDRVMIKDITQACRLNASELSNLRLEGHDEEDEDDYTFDHNENATLGDLELELEDDDNFDINGTSQSRFGSRGNMGGINFNSHNLNYQPQPPSWEIPLLEDDIINGICTACQEGFPEHKLAHCPCDHDYCRECLADLFNASMIDDGLFPPRCCKEPIVPANYHKFLTPEIILRFDEKKIELETDDRTYCSNQVCSVFIPPKNILGDQAKCPTCGTISCARCKTAAHNGDCPADTELQNVLDIAKTKGWQRCFNCRRVIELAIGCNHITCFCGTEFCYVCAATWKTCTCPQWDEELLLARANDHVARNPVEVINGERRVAAIVQDLRIQHHCNHDEWRWIRGRHHCDQCFQTLPSYTFECTHCLVRVCNRCRRNRI